MTVASQETIFHHVGNGVTVTFAYGCQIAQDADLQVYVDDVLTTSGFTVAGIGTLTGGTVTFSDPPANGVAVRLAREIALERPIDYQNNGDFRARVVNIDFDRIWMALQQQASGFFRALKVPKSETVAPSDLPVAAERANRLLGFDAVGNPMAIDMSVAPERPVQLETQIAGAGQTLFTLARITYTPGIGSLHVYVDGFRLLGTEYTETSSNAVTFQRPAKAGAELLFEAGSGVNSQSAVDAAMIPYHPAGAGSVASNVETKLRESISAFDRGADTTGFANSSPALTNMLASAAGSQKVTVGTYQLDTDVTPAARDIALSIDPAVNFTGAGKLRLSNQVPYQATPVGSLDLLRKTFTNAWAGFGNIFMRACYAVSNLATVPVVALFSGAEAVAANSKAWALNTVCYANHGSATTISYELNYGVLALGGTAYGIVIASAGNFQPQNAIQIQTNNAASQAINGIKFNWRDVDGCVTGALFFTSGAVGATCQHFIRLNSITASVAEVDLPSFVVEATQANTVNRLSIRGSATGVAPRLTASGTDANISLDFRGKGTGVAIFTNNGAENFRVKASAGTESLQAGAGTGSGTLEARGVAADVDVIIVGKGTSGVRIRDGASADKVRVNTTGIGFYAATPVAQATTGGAASAFVVGAGTAVNDASTFDGYTMKQVVKALRNLGVLA